jgi:hypothetical protein
MTGLIATEWCGDVEFLQQVADDGETYQIDPEMDGVEPFLYHFEKIEQIDTCATHWSAFDVSLEHRTLAEDFDFFNQDAHQRGNNLEKSDDEQVFEVLQDPQHSIHPCLDSADHLIQPAFDQNKTVGTSLCNSSEGISMVPFQVVTNVLCAVHFCSHLLLFRTPSKLHVENMSRIGVPVSIK